MSGGIIRFTNIFTGATDAVIQHSDGKITLSSNGQVIGNGSSDALTAAKSKFDGTSRRIVTFRGIGTPRISSS